MPDLRQAENRSSAGGAWKKFRQDYYGQNHSIVLPQMVLTLNFQSRRCRIIPTLKNQLPCTDFDCQNSLDTDESEPPNKIFNG
ncbi:hypothetical protein EDS67_03260 [candidate division KSB1 bacterium]|nr:MAG: hypothetical protein EDS67_03260 [candidate division KSB1 bacterium]MBC6949864.1 hypothetical protein [candidate division KSB1 bacterium]MCE7940901.1 hypothetical protein [Chlorobi bacterium CHB1]